MASDASIYTYAVFFENNFLFALTQLYIVISFRLHYRKFQILVCIHVNTIAYIYMSEDKYSFMSTHDHKSTLFL